MSKQKLSACIETAILLAAVTIGEHWLAVTANSLQRVGPSASHTGVQAEQRGTCRNWTIKDQTKQEVSFTFLSTSSHRGRACGRLSTSFNMETGDSTLGLRINRSPLFSWIKSAECVHVLLLVVNQWIPPPSFPGLDKFSRRAFC